MTGAQLACACWGLIGYLVGCVITHLHHTSMANRARERELKRMKETHEEWMALSKKWMAICKDWRDLYHNKGA